MKKKYGFYCSGSAGRVLEFYKTRDTFEYPVSFILYDGGNLSILKSLAKLFGNNLVTFDNDNNLKGKELSQHISNLLLNSMIENSIDYLFCFGNRILKHNLIDAFQNRIINFHPSILPSFPGVNAIDQALASSVQLLGNTAHFIDKGIDTGPIIMQTVLSRQMFTNYNDVLNLQLPMLEKIWYMLDNDLLQVNGGKVNFKIKTNSNILFSI